MEQLRKIKQALEDSHFKMQELNFQKGPKYHRPQLNFWFFLDSLSVKLFWLVRKPPILAFPPFDNFLPDIHNNPFTFLGNYVIIFGTDIFSSKCTIVQCAKRTVGRAKSLFRENQFWDQRCVIKSVKKVICWLSSKRLKVVATGTATNKATFLIEVGSKKFKNRIFAQKRQKQLENYRINSLLHAFEKLQST